MYFGSSPARSILPDSSLSRRFRRRILLIKAEIVSKCSSPDLSYWTKVSWMAFLTDLAVIFLFSKARTISKDFPTPNARRRPDALIRSSSASLSILVFGEIFERARVRISKMSKSPRIGLRVSTRLLMRLADWWFRSSDFQWSRRLVKSDRFFDMQQASCWDLLKRWISSTKRTVRIPKFQFWRARSTRSMSFLPEVTAEISIKSASTSRDNSRKCGFIERQLDPKNQRNWFFSCYDFSQNSIFTQKMLLSNNLIQCLWSHFAS